MIKLRSTADNKFKKIISRKLRKTHPYANKLSVKKYDSFGKPNRREKCHNFENKSKFLDKCRPTFRYIFRCGPAMLLNTEIVGKFFIEK